MFCFVFTFTFKFFGNSSGLFIKFRFTTINTHLYFVDADTYLGLEFGFENDIPNPNLDADSVFGI